MQSKKDGQYLYACPDPHTAVKYLLVFSEQAEALGYVNTHAPEVSDRFAVHSLSSPQLQAVMARWEFQGIGWVQDYLTPRIQFMHQPLRGEPTP
ncbi:hypothetical protein [Lyngbya confervoides]|uniref:Uncharacterized protein n=1 Tax=Lyngbya confervoides BDU141951 TaxID=1574623 RepID=A0ABD4T264_9CYAN|nr:hypothetical protein [Lyngbya confervoides]MCM1982481.1 hypothetical protein [Lyngbya confervoides BDU141951]